MKRKPYPSDLTDAEWQLVEPLIPPANPGKDLGSAYMREIVNAIVYAWRIGCLWEMLPDDFPHHSTVSFYFRHWQQQGVWQQMKECLEKREPVAARGEPKASAGIINSQSQSSQLVRTAKSLNVKVIEQSFALVKPNATAFASSFYKNLFTDYPQIRPLFAHTTMEFQQQKLMITLTVAISNLRNLAYLKSILRDLGERHVRYGVIQQYYPMVGAALLKTLAFYLGTAWTPELKQAWIEAYEAITHLMQPPED